MKKLSSLIVSLVFLLTACTTPDKPFVLKRGTNLSHWLSQSPLRGEERARRVEEDDIARLKELGFDHVRIPIDEEQFWDEEGNQLPEAWALLTRTLDLTQQYGLRAIVDLHIVRSHHFNAGFDGGKNTLFEDPAQQEKLVDLWRQLSAVLHSYKTSMVAYEFMNEPVADDPEQWNQLIAMVHHELRSLEPNRTLVIGSNLWQGVRTFKDLKVPANDPHILLSFHFYEPMILTHYKAEWSEYGRYTGEFQYPGVMLSDDDYQSLSDEQQQLLAPFMQDWNRDMLKAMIQQAADVAAQYNLPLYCGEWGVYYTAPAEQKYQWYRDMISIFDELNIGWSTWCYDSGFGFWKRDDSGFDDKPMLDILLSGKALGE
ncbi:MAG: glycoside hydrolase family 5 protein [Paludibacteraceae bacterium]|nr:glycoside hydrolase family 5 protein [Paludibacteraceae bacterium]